MRISLCYCAYSVTQVAALAIREEGVDNVASKQSSITETLSPKYLRKHAGIASLSSSLAGHIIECLNFSSAMLTHVKYS